MALSAKQYWSSLFSLLQSQEEHLPVDDGFLDMISKSQSRRLDDQRSTFPDSAANTPEEARHLTQGGRCEEEDLFDTLWRLQGSRIDDQRCDMPSPANGLSHHHGVDDQERWEEGEAECLSSDELFDMIFECQVCSVPGYCYVNFLSWHFFTIYHQLWNWILSLLDYFLT